MSADPSAPAGHRPHPAAPQPPGPPGAPVIGFSTRLPPELVERLRIAAPQLRMRQADITARALDAFLRTHGK